MNLEQVTPESAPIPVPVSTAPQVAFTGRRGPLFKLLLKVTLLTILTLGIYRFWGKVHIRRFFWHNIRLLGDPLEYTGTPMELFLGFLIVIAALIPLTMAYAGLEALALSAGQDKVLFAQIGYYTILFALIQIGFYRMWRYRLTRTSWRGIRVGQVGSSLHYMWRAMGWALLTVFTLGVAYPWMRVDLTRYRLNNNLFGSSRFNFEGLGKALLVPWLWVLAFSLLPWGVFIALNAELIKPMISSLAQGQVFTAESLPGSSGVILLTLAAPLLYLWFKVREFRYVAANTRFAETAFRSDIRTSAVIVAGLMTGFAFVFLIALVVIITLFAAVLGTVAEFVAPIISIIIIFMLGPILSYLIFRFELVGAVCRTLTLSDSEALAGAVQRSDEDPTYGEGLADAFDIGAV